MRRTYIPKAVTTLANPRMKILDYKGVDSEYKAEFLIRKHLKKVFDTAGFKFEVNRKHSDDGYIILFEDRFGKRLGEIEILVLDRVS